MPDVKQVTVIVANPNPNDPTDTGRVTLGYYILDGDRLTMTDGKGEPFRGKGGDRVPHKLQTGEDPTMIAKRLTMKIYRMVRGGDMAGFNRPIVLRLSPMPGDILVCLVWRASGKNRTQNHCEQDYPASGRRDREDQAASPRH